jgi:hypothetical protein
VGQPFTHSFPHANIHELLAPDLLHQLIKGVFKDHLVEWVLGYLHRTHGTKCALEIIEDIDHWYDLSFFLVLMLINCLALGYQLYLPSLVFADSQMGVILSNGQVMT